MQQFGSFFRKTLYIHRVLAGEVCKSGDNPRAAVFVGTEYVCAHLPKGRATERADGGFGNIATAFGVLNRAEYLGYDLIGAADKHFTARLYTLAHYIAVVVERSLAHGYAGKLHGLELGKRRKFTRSPDLPAYFAYRGYALLRLEFVGYRPAREFIGTAKHGARGHIVELDNRTVGQNVYVSSANLYLVYGSKHLVLSFAQSAEGKHFKTLILQPFKAGLLRCRQVAIHIIYIVKIYIRSALCRDGGVEVSYCTRGRVARVFERLCRRLIVVFKHAQTDYSLALYFHRTGIGNSERESSYCKALCGYIFAHNTVAARSCAHKHAA